ncbi:unnamed protein product, partial [Mesorhabditis spiculigera]
MLPARRRSLVVKLLLLIPAVWFFVLIYFASSNDKNQPYDRQVEPVAPRIDREKLPPIVVNVPTAKRDEDGNQGQGNMPMPKFIVDVAEPIYQRGNMSQAGEEGKAVNVDKTKLSKSEKAKYDQGFQNNAFNQYASDMISIHRTLPKNVDEECKVEPYPKDLPDTSVIICFHNEAWSVLLRTVHSVLERTPDQYLNEIILVDDFSDMAHTKQALESYVSQYPKVKILRMEKREGLIRARLRGASAAKGKVLTYLDSHCECMDGWIEPLLARIKKDPSIVVCPVIDVIDDNTFEYHYSKAYFTNVGGFDWGLQFNWHAIPERDRKGRRAIDPVRSPTMAGGLFSIDRDYFEKLGTYDPGFDIWGGENLELSFKIWMCGGTLEIVPCSHVGHIFRKRSPYKWRTGVNVLKRNSVRLAEVWLDEYKEYYYERINHQLVHFFYQRKALRNRLGCKSFKWYLDNIFPELFVPGDSVAKGEVRNLGGDGRKCLDCMVNKHDKNKPVGLYPCHGQGGNQYWMYSKDGEIRRDESCIDFAGAEVMIFPCHGMKGNQEWKYDNNASKLLHVPTGKCLGMTHDGSQLLMQKCDDGDAYQKWRFKEYNEAKAKEYGRQ